MPGCGRAADWRNGTRTQAFQFLHGHTASQPGQLLLTAQVEAQPPPPHVRTGLAAVGRASANPGESRMEMMVQLLACLSPTSQKLVRLPWKEKPLQLSCNKVF